MGRALGKVGGPLCGLALPLASVHIGGYDVTPLLENGVDIARSLAPGASIPPALLSRSKYCDSSAQKNRGMTSSLVLPRLYERYFFHDHLAHAAIRQLSTAVDLGGSSGRSWPTADAPGIP